MEAGKREVRRMRAGPAVPVEVAWGGEGTAGPSSQGSRLFGITARGQHTKNFFGPGVMDRGGWDNW